MKDAWRHLRDAYRKKQLKVTAGGAGGSGGVVDIRNWALLVTQGRK